MGTHARIGNGFILIDACAWLDQRVAGPRPDLTRDLHDWATQRPGATADVAASRPPRLGRYGWQQAVLAWCDARGHAGPDPSDPLAGPELISHEATRLDRDLWVARALTPDGHRIVVVQTEDDAPTVHDDHVTDSARWYDADTVDISCPNGHGWTWRSGRELLTADGSFTTLTVVFGPNLDAPFSRCGDCQAYDLGRRSTSCRCDRSPWIVCPTCGQRCDVELTSR